MAKMEHGALKAAVPGCGCADCNAKRHEASRRRGRGTIMLAAQPTNLAVWLAALSWVAVFLAGLGLGAILWA